MRRAVGRAECRCTCAGYRRLRVRTAPAGDIVVGRSRPFGIGRWNGGALRAGRSRGTDACGASCGGRRLGRFLLDPFQTVFVKELDFVDLDDIGQDRVVVGEMFRRRDVGLQLLQVSFQLRPPVLKPRDHLGVGEAKALGDLVAISRRQILLIEEALLELVYLLICEGRTRFTPFLGRLSFGEEVQLLATRTI